MNFHHQTTSFIMKLLYELKELKYVKEIQKKVWYFD